MARSATAKNGKANGKAEAKAKPRAKAAAKPVPAGPWAGATLAVVLIVMLLRLVIDGLELIPVQFDEAQYWAYGQELAWGYFSKPPLIAWVIRAVTDVMGDSLFALRLPSPMEHALIAWLIFLTGRRLWDGMTGFWAAAGYTAAPGVAYSAMLMSTDPMMMVFWAAALYAWVRAAEAEEGEDRFWWAVLGAAIGAGAMAKYTMLVFVVGGVFYGIFSARERAWVGTGIAALVALALISPNVWWNWQHHFATVGHVAGDADPGSGYFHPAKFAEFFGAQFAVIGPVFLIAIFLALWHRREWRADWGMRMMAWQTFTLLGAILVLSFLTRAQANWAAPAYVAGALLAARWLVLAGGIRALRAQLGIGVAASLGLWILCFLYAGQSASLTQKLDPFRKLRISEPMCELVLSTMSEEGVGVMLSDSRQRLSECMFYGELGWDDVAIWNPDGRPDNHHELVVSLHPGDQREMLLVTEFGARGIARHFREAREIESGTLGTHLDRSTHFELWVVKGFKGY